MYTEIEAKFLGVDHDAVRQKLKSVGAERAHPMRLMRRKNYDYPDFRLETQFTGWVRVRDEGDKVTLAYKQLDDRTLTGTKEVSVVVGDFDDTCRFLEAIGLEVQSYQETKRESWKLGGVEIELDEWPWIPPFVEIEAPDEALLRQTSQQIGLKWSDAVHGSVEIAYQSVYDVTEEEVCHWQEILFTPVPAWLEEKRKT